MSNEATPTPPAAAGTDATGLLSLARHLRDEAEGTRVRHNIRTAYVALSIDDIVKLVDGLEAYHAKAVSELRSLLSPLGRANSGAAYDLGSTDAAIEHNARIHEAARALGLTL
jgi:hypothetical protein